MQNGQAKRLTMAGSKHKSRKRGGRSRSFGGCVTCRSRHLKCDETHPVCTTCVEAGLKCGGYDKEVFFEAIEASDVTRFRRPLFTEEERIRMSEALVESVSSNLVTWNIEQLDQKCEEASHADAFEAYHGPFGAFKLSGLSIPVEEAQLGNPTKENSISANQTDYDVYHQRDLVVEPQGDQQLGSGLELSLPSWSPIPDFDLFDLCSGSGSAEEILDFDISVSGPEPSPAMPLRNNNFNQPIYIAPQDVLEYSSYHLASELTTVPPRIEISLPHDAVYLIKHYSTTVLRILTPFRHTKTPWHVIFIPHAKGCLAALTMGECLDHASICAFYGMLAIAAFSLCGTCDSSTWLDSAQIYKSRATQYGRQMIDSAYNTPKTAKYKSVLVALLTMTQLSMISGNTEQTDRYLLEAEKFIRVKGLNRKKSRKVRLLHHCYAYERVLHESTFAPTFNSSHRIQIRRAIESSGAVAYSHDSLTFRLGDWSNLENEMARIKNKEEGENDLHLEVPGVWSATLYPEIFGIPEIYVFLLSLTIRLGEQKDAAEQRHTNTPIGLQEFLTRAKAVERCINSLRKQNYAESRSENENTTPSTKPILEAMQNALAIYFYRRIYDIEHALLEPKVEAIKMCLMDLEPNGLDSLHGAARLIWPAFIAGCESESAATRAAIASWLENVASSSGLRLFSDVKSSMERVWIQKMSYSGGNTSWFEILRTEQPPVAAF